MLKSSSPIPPLGKGLLLLTQKKKILQFVDIIACQHGKSQVRHPRNASSGVLHPAHELRKTA